MQEHYCTPCQHVEKNERACLQTRFITVYIFFYSICAGIIYYDWLPSCDVNQELEVEKVKT